MKTRGTISLVAVIAIILSLGGQAAHAQMIGEVGVLRGMKEGALTVPVAVDKKAHSALYAAIVANDEEGINELISNGRLFIVDVGTKVRVIGGSWSTMDIRILEGANNGRRGLVSNQLVTTSRSNAQQSRKSMEGESHKLDKFTNEHLKRIDEEAKATYEAGAEARKKEWQESFDKIIKDIDDEHDRKPTPVGGIVTLLASVCLIIFLLFKARKTSGT